MKILIISDAWHPQINGVVRTYDHNIRELEKLGHTVHVISPSDYRTIPMPFYPEIRLAYSHVFSLVRRIRDLSPDSIHIATEGPLGFVAASYLRRRKILYTSAYHTKFPEYAKQKIGVPESVSYWCLDWIHAGSVRILVSTDSLSEELRARGLRHTALWSKGVDRSIFTPRAVMDSDTRRPISLYVGRVSSEKNLEAFLSLDIPGTKIVVGDGPQRRSYEMKYPHAIFVGYKKGVELAAYFQQADVFVFPSRTDTFGIVLVEAMACGTPVAAFDVTGPKDIVTNGLNGFTGPDLSENFSRCLSLDRGAVAASADRWSWEQSAKEFVSYLALIGRRSNGDAISALTQRDG